IWGRGGRKDPGQVLPLFLWFVDDGLGRMPRRSRHTGFRRNRGSALRGPIMSGYLRIALGLAVCSSIVPPVVGQEPPARPKAKVELRGVETKRGEGLTEDKGFQSSCAPNDIVSPQKKPPLVPPAAEVAEARLNKHDFGGSGLGVNYMVTLHLTKEAR